MEEDKISYSSISPADVEGHHRILGSEESEDLTSRQSYGGGDATYHGFAKPSGGRHLSPRGNGQDSSRSELLLDLDPSEAPGIQMYGV